MRKIKNFKINLSDKEIVRVIKKLKNTPELPEETHRSISQACRFYLDFIHPCIIYETFPKESLIFEDEKDLPPKLVAKTVFFATIGSCLDEEYAKNKRLYAEDTETIVSVIAVESLEQAKRFALRLISQEAEKENCSLLHSIEIAPQNYEKLNNLIDISKIGLTSGEGKLNPPYSLCEMSYWIASKKKTKNKIGLK